FSAKNKLRPCVTQPTAPSFSRRISPRLGRNQPFARIHLVRCVITETLRGQPHAFLSLSESPRPVPLVTRNCNVGRLRRQTLLERSRNSTTRVFCEARPITHLGLKVQVSSVLLLHRIGHLKNSIGRREVPANPRTPAPDAPRAAAIFHRANHGLPVNWISPDRSPPCPPNASKKSSQRPESLHVARPRRSSRPAGLP